MIYKDVLSVEADLYNQLDAIHLKPKKLSRMAEGFITRTIFGNYNFISTIKRIGSASLTIYTSSQKVRQHNLNKKKRGSIRC